MTPWRKRFPRTPKSDRRFDAPHSIENWCQHKRRQPQVVAVEPWGEDDTLLPGEQLDIIAFCDTEVPWFHVVESDGTSQVYCEGTFSFKVIQNGVLVGMWTQQATQLVSKR